MTHECPNCEVAERQLDRVQNFFPRLDSKVSALFAITSGEIAVATINLAPDDFKLWYIAVPAVCFALLTIGTLWFLYKCTFPHLDGGNNSLIYFKEVAKLTEQDYVRRFTTYVASDRLNDLAGQIWQNSKIATLKYDYLKRAMLFSVFSLLPWTATLLATSLTHWRAPLAG
jgi:hypothetical protein